MFRVQNLFPAIFLVLNIINDFKQINDPVPHYR